MRVLQVINSQATQDGDGVNIRRVADFQRLALDPYLMLDEIRSDDEKDYVGGFPPHPHRGMETFTYIRKGGFEHRDQMGHVKAIRAGKVQWMSTGRGVVHSEMPLADAKDGLHGFQIWINMAAKDKMRPPQYQDTGELHHATLAGEGCELYLLAGQWHFNQQTATGPLTQLAANSALADLSLAANASASLNLSQYGFSAVYIYDGSLRLPTGLAINAGSLLVIDSQTVADIRAGEAGAGMLVLAGNPIGEAVVQMGPFVMNTQAEIMQAVRDYQSGKFGDIV
ncbi:pirin [Shewanella mangrovi]|uniref:Pirin n=1 Tax=Shewanella mangrovi TaxID=1515746 RepID=A0A094JGE5_9GAMM|nr:pirin family protein [Shewanella mangrovi]KFZ39005.1 pirin [Shewanella mangrovi]